MPEPHAKAADTDEDGPECETCGKTTCPDADLPGFSEPVACAYAPIYETLRDARDCDYGCARDYTNQAVRLRVVKAVEGIVAAHLAAQAAPAPGPCWHDPGVTWPTGVSPRCELRAGHAGAHECDRGSMGGSAVWTEEEAAPARHVALAEDVRAISTMISGSYPEDLDPEAHLWRRCMKVTEEAGEVFEALAGTVGENPRKGQTHTRDDLRDELLDVAGAALGAVSHLGDDRNDPVLLLSTRLAYVRERLAAAVTPDEPATLDGSAAWGDVVRRTTGA